MCLSHTLLMHTSLYQTCLHEHEDKSYPTTTEKRELDKGTQMTVVSPFHVLNLCVLKFSNTKSYLSPQEQRN